MRTILSYVFSVFAVLFGVFGLIGILLWYAILNPNLYINSLEQSGIYKQINEVLKEQTIAGLEQLEEGAVTAIFDALIKPTTEEGSPLALLEVVKTSIVDAAVELLQSKTELVVDNIFAKAEVEQKIQNAGNQAVVQSISWLRGDKEDPKFFRYIPTPQQVKIAEEQGIVKLVATYIVAEISGVSNLPQCETTEQESQNLYYIDTNQFQQIDCITENIRPALYQSASNIIPPTVNEKIEIALDGLVTEYKLEPVLDSLYEILNSLATIKESLINLRAFFEQLKVISIILIVVSLVFALITLGVTETQKVRRFAAIYLAISIIVLVFGIVNVYILNPMIINSISFDNFSTQSSISPARQVLLAGSIKQFVEMILEGIYSPMLKVSTFMLLVSGVGYFVLFFINKRETEQQKEEVKQEIVDTKKSTEKEIAADLEKEQNTQSALENEANNTKQPSQTETTKAEKSKKSNKTKKK